MEIEDTELELNKIRFEIEKSRGHFLDWDYQTYSELRERERGIAENPSVRETPAETVVEDMNRYGNTQIPLLTKIFFENTMEETREAKVFGRYGKINYFCMGDNISSPKLKLALVSSHVPGSSGGGGHGFKGIRRLCLIEPPFFGTDPEYLLEKGTRAKVEEGYNGNLEYWCRGSNHPAQTILRLAIESEKLK